MNRNPGDEMKTLDLQRYNFGFAEIRFECLNLGNISNHSQLSSWPNSGPQILIESLALDTGGKSSKKHGDYPQRGNILYEREMGERYKFAFLKKQWFGARLCIAVNEFSQYK